MKNYNEFENELFEEWKARSLDNNDGDELVSDGLLYRGNIEYNSNGNWVHNKGNESELWEKSAKRILILSKDLNDDEAWDVRGETGRKNKLGQDNIIIVTARFYKNMMIWIYGLLNVDKNGKTPDFDAIDSSIIYQPFFDKAPIARINCKKQVGKGEIENVALQDFMERYKDLLIKQINVYDADIILCFGGQSIIKDFVADHCIDDLEKVNNYIYYSKHLNKTVIDAYHPSYLGYSNKKLYTELMENYEEFIKNNLSFLKPCR